MNELTTFCHLLFPCLKNATLLSFPDEAKISCLPNDKHKGPTYPAYFNLYFSSPLKLSVTISLFQRQNWALPSMFSLYFFQFLSCTYCIILWLFIYLSNYIFDCEVFYGQDLCIIWVDILSTWNNVRHWVNVDK